MVSIVLYWCLAGIQGSPAVDLKATVERYWTLLSEGQKAEAMRFVHPDDIANFINRRDPSIRDWVLDGIESEKEGEATVTVSFDRLFPGGSRVRVGAGERWVREKEGWRVRIPSPEEVGREGLPNALVKSSSVIAGRLQVLPKTLKFYAVSDQPGVIVIRNGLTFPVRVLEVVVDQELFRVGETPSEVPAGSVARIAVRFVGVSEDGERSSEAVLVVQENQENAEARRISIPVRYNAVDPLHRRLRGRKPPSH